jgi:ribosome biogenesis GTPase / thiamine phosphate phosphatase
LTLSLATPLEELGWDEAWAAEFEPHRALGLVPGRVAIQHRGAYVLATPEGEVWAELPRRLLRLAEEDGGAMPAVGDWVGYRPSATGGRVHLEVVLPRRSAFSRNTAWQETREQVVAANVDTVFLVQGIPLDLSARRLERYLATAWESGATPVIVLTKTDLADDLEPYLAEVESVAFGVPVHAVSNVTGEGLAGLRAYAAPGRTVALLGSSGVGKSTLVNSLLGTDALETQELRADGRGRHTTTRRELVLLPGGGIVLDTPGMRELQLWDVDEGLQQAFSDVEELAAQCRFSDCGHASEPGCAIRDALETGALRAERWESYLKLQRELAALHVRMDVQARREQKRQIRVRARAMRKRGF